MNNIPHETLELILSHIEESMYQKSERFPTLTATSRRGILSARHVWCAYRKRRPLRQLFVKALEEHPFKISDAEDQRGWISGLDALSRSEYAYDIATLSICPMIFRDHLQVRSWLDGALDALAIGVSRLPILEHIRYYTLPSSCVRGVWRSGGDHLWDGVGRYASNEAFNLSMRPDIQVAKGLSQLQRCFANGTLTTLIVTYYGNLGTFCALPWTFMTIDQSMFPASPRRVSVNLVMQREGQYVFDTWIYLCPNLEYLEIAMCRAPDFYPKPLDVQSFWNHEVRGPLENPPAKLAEIRLLSNTGFYIDGSKLLMGLVEFPTLKKLALGHFMMRNRTWIALFDGLRNVEKWKVELDALWLLNPTTNTVLPVNWGTWPVLPYRRYDDDNVAWETAKGAAREIRIVHLPFPWGEGPVVAGIGRGYEFPRFELFEDDEQ